MKSMTGFGRSEQETSLGKIVIEIQSINRKYFELNVSLPKELSRFEIEIRKKVSEFVQRGLVWLRIHIFPNTASLEQTLPDVQMLKSLQSYWKKTAVAIHLDPESIDLPFLLSRMAEMPSLLKMMSDSEFLKVEAGVDVALKSLDKMKSTEGAFLSKDILQRLIEMEKKLQEIERLAPDATAKMREKLKERMEEIFSQSSELDERLLREVALFAERVDISEEITRFRSHLVQYKELLRQKMGPHGRKMDFLTQEMGREINTIGSKAMDACISHLVVDVKAELDKVREQIQNIE